MPVGYRKHRNYYSVSDGRIRQKTDEKDPNAQYREGTVDGKKYEIYELVFDYITGRITDIDVSDSEYGRNLEITLEDPSGENIIRMKWNSVYANTFLSKCPNLDFSKEVTIEPFYFKKDKKARLILIQDNNKIKAFYTKENPQGMPRYPADGSEDEFQQWKVDISKFFYSELMNRIKPMIYHDDPLADKSLEETEVDETIAGEKEEEGKDGLPF